MLLSFKEVKAASWGNSQGRHLEAGLAESPASHLLPWINGEYHKQTEMKHLVLIASCKAEETNSELEGAESWFSPLKCQVSKRVYKIRSASFRLLENTDQNPLVWLVMNNDPPSN